MEWVIFCDTFEHGNWQPCDYFGIGTGNLLELDQTKSFQYLKCPYIEISEIFEVEKITLGRQTMIKEGASC